ncbi:MAG TPA: hypothetical protein VLW85_13305 [Myxococcales bacterium]|nr:hypothetical protein [Myxococcales bacterium]
MARWLRRLVQAAAALWLLWIVGANAWLNSGLTGVPLISVRDAEVRAGRAFSWWPGKVSGRGLRVVVHDSNVEMELNVGEFDLTLSLLSAVHKQLRTTHARLSGVSLRLRKTRFLDALCARAGLPPIAGQADPPIAGRDCLAQKETAHPKGPPPNPEDLFHLQLDGLEARDVGEVWIEGVRLLGDVALEGSWLFWPKREMEIHLHDLAVHGASLAMGPLQLAAKVDVALIGDLARLPLDRVEAKDFWRAVTARISMDLGSLQLRTIREALMSADPIAPPRLPGMEGLAMVQSESRLEQGHVREFSLAVRAQDAGLKLLDRRLDGALRLGVHMAEDPQHPGRLLFTRSGLAIAGPRLDGQRFDDVEITLDALGTSHLDPEKQRADLDFSAHVSKVRFLVALIPGGLPQSVAKLLLDGSDPAVAAGALHATGKDAEVSDFHAQAGSLHLDGGFRFAPALDGKLTAKYGPISVDVPLK